MRRVGVLLIAVAFLLGSISCTVHDSRSSEAAQEAKQAANEAKEAGKEAAAEGKAAADDAKREAEDARREADQARRDAMNDAKQQADDARRQAEDARRDAMAQVRNNGDKDDDDRRDNSSSGDVVNINRASAEDITNATGLATNVAQKIVAARPYVSKRDLVSKKVLDEQTYWKIEKHVTVMSK